MFVENVTIEFVAGMLFALACAVSRRIEPHVTRLAITALKNEQRGIKGSLNTFRTLPSKGKVAVAALVVPTGGVLMANAALTDSAPLALQIAGGVVMIFIVALIARRGLGWTIGRMRTLFQ